MEQNSKYPKPILKWVGGKTQIIDEVISKFPKNINNYREIFLGGGSVLLAFLTEIKNANIKVNDIYAYDLNSNLIDLYNNIKNNPKELFEETNKLKQEYEALFGNIKNLKDYEEKFKKEENKRQKINPKTKKEAEKSPEHYYYWIRNEFNNNKNITNIQKSAMFIFLNKTCFRGLYRIGPNGFNVPYGNYIKPEIINEEHILEISNLIQNVIFTHMSFEDSINQVEPDDFVYLDPPYVPEKMESFVGYNADGFDEAQHIYLFELCNEMYNCGIKFLMSNSDDELVKNSFDKTKFIIKTIKCKRAINSKNPDATTNELLIFY